LESFAEHGPLDLHRAVIIRICENLIEGDGANLVAKSRICPCDISTLSCLRYTVNELMKDVEASYLAQGKTELREQVTKQYVSENWDKVEAFGTT
jgi:hypothetical protein